MESVLPSNINNSALIQKRTYVFDKAEIECQLQKYLLLGLEPIPLKGKIPLVRWTKFHPKSMSQLLPYVKAGISWGIKTGSKMSVLDFDSEQAFTVFIENNQGKLCKEIPIVQTGRGYHVYFKPKSEVRGRGFVNFDIKGVGGYVVAPPSGHANGNAYRFLDEYGCVLGDVIPELNINDLDLSMFEARGNASAVDNTGRLDKVVENSNGVGNAHPHAFDIQNDENHITFWESGVIEGARNRTLYEYIRYMQGVGADRAEIIEQAHVFGQKCDPPMSKSEINSTIASCLKSYKANVLTTTSAKKQTVVVETKASDKATEASTTDTDEAIEVEPRPKAIPLKKTIPMRPVNGVDQSSWSLEIDKTDWVPYCGQYSKVVKKGREYAAKRLRCGNWRCPTCGPNFKIAWIDHLVGTVDASNLYITCTNENDWARLHKAINRLKSNYIKIATSDDIVVVTDIQMKGSEILSAINLEKFLKKTIPSVAEQCPISTSKAWQRNTTEKEETGWRLAFTAHVPAKEIQDMAIQSGAIKNDQREIWTLPDDIDQELWDARFETIVRDREREIIDRIKESNQPREREFIRAG